VIESVSFASQPGGDLYPLLGRGSHGS
jgi:hypothetical protein